MRVLKYLALGIVALIAAALILEAVLRAKDSHDYPMPGRLVDIGSHEMHIWCEGTGRPTVVLDAGAIAFSTSWRAVVPLVADSTRVCAFDRSGLGWSEAGPGPWDGNQAADELSQLLRAAGINEPVIYVGHSLGAMLARIFAHRHPEQLAGLVLIEPADPEIIIGEFNEEREEPLNRDMPDLSCGMRCPVMMFVASTGIPRWMLSGQELLEDPNLPGLAVEEFVARSVRPANIRHLVYMGRFFPRIFFSDTRQHHARRHTGRVRLRNSQWRVARRSFKPGRMERGLRQTTRCLAKNRGNQFPVSWHACSNRRKSPEHSYVSRTRTNGCQCDS